MYDGLEAALLIGGELQRVCVGKDDHAKGLHRWYVRDGTGTITPVVPADQHDLAYSGWLAQKAIGYAAELLPVDDTEFDEVRPDKKSRAVAWPRDPDTGRHQEFAVGMWDDPDALKDKLEELIEEEEREEGRRAAHEELDRQPALLQPAERRILSDVFDHMRRTGEEYGEARKAVARKIAKSSDPKAIAAAENWVDKVMTKLRARAAGITPSKEQSGRGAGTHTTERRAHTTTATGGADGKRNQDDFRGGGVHVPQRRSDTGGAPSLGW